MNLSEKIINISRKLDKIVEEELLESVINLKDEELIALYVLSKYKIKPGTKELKVLEKIGYIKSNKLTKEGIKFLKTPTIKKKLDMIMS